MKSLKSEDEIRWDFDILNDILSERDRELILQISLSNGAKNDNWFWFGIKKRHFHSQKWIQSDDV